MPIFSKLEKNGIIEEVKTNYPSKTEQGFQYNLEVFTGLRIIKKVFGDEWFQRASQDIGDTKMDPLQEPPIKYYLKMNEPKKIVQLLNFANFLRNLYGKCNLDEKIKEYTKKQNRASITTESFNKLHTELKIADYFLEKGFKVKFLKESKSKKTPDLKIISKDGDALIECKRKKDDGKILVDSIRESFSVAKEQLENSDLPGIIYIDIPIMKNFKVSSKRREFQLDDLFLLSKNVHYLVLGGEWQEISEPGRVHTETFMYSYENKIADPKLSPSIEDVVRDIVPPPQKLSLLDD